ncbi:MAG: family 20 glycosylhydrolase [candidate division KSB1 bacterium]|nr:family 20 glycosylhydrolase [candidate division KSB1 bacterium]
MSLNLMPWPADLQLDQGAFRLGENFTVGLQGNGGTRAYSAATRVLQRLAARTGLFFSQWVLSPRVAPDQGSLLIAWERQGELRLGEDESYTLRVAPEGIELRGKTDLGIVRGLETLLQLLAADEKGYYFPAVTIHDRPRFPWRGLLIDACRHFMPVEVIKRNIDGMAAVKLNVLHWHLTEDQGFRVECLTYPKLHELGSDGLYYTQAQIREIIAYAAERGIRVMPEFDMPGHTTSWFVGYPELASAPGPYTIERTWGIKDPTMDPTREETYKFLNKFFREMCALFLDEYVHIGGDENTGKQWDANPAIQKFMRQHKIADNNALQAYFNRRVQAILSRYGKKMVGWDEIFHPELPTTIVIHSWRGRQAMNQAAQRGYRSILSNGYYIDLMQPTDFHYLNDPLPDDTPLSATEQELVLGGEATMWSEFVSAENVDSRIWPRTAAIAERLWSPRQVRDVADMYRRLEVVQLQLEEHGLTHEKNYEMMLRRLSNGHDPAPLRTLVDVLEPVKGYARGRSGRYTSFSPLTRVVDTARPDPLTVRRFRVAVQNFLANRDQTSMNTMRNMLCLWRDNHARLLPVLRSSPIIQEVEPLSADMARVATIGLQALEYLTHGQFSASWQEKALADLEECRAPRAEAELMIVGPVEELVRACGPQGPRSGK